MSWINTTFFLLITIASGFKSFSQNNKYRAEGDKPYTTKTHPMFSLCSVHDSLGWAVKVGALETLPDGSVLIATWDSIGGIYRLWSSDGSWRKDGIQRMRIAAGLCEPLGMKWINSRLFVAQRPEITELIDRNSDGIFETYRTLTKAFGYMGNYHEFTFGLLYRKGYLYGTLSTPRRTRMPSMLDRGTAFKVQIETGAITYLATGFRTPNGLGFTPDSFIVINDNQGEWVPVSKLVVLDSGAFYGYRDVDFRGTSELPVAPPAIWMPHFEVANSPSQPLFCIHPPFKGQLIFGDVTHGGIKRVFLEKVDSVYQGCIFNFTQGLAGGINRIAWASDGALWVGAVGSASNWGQGLPKLRYGLQRLVPTGKTAFDMHHVRALSDGFCIQFTDSLAYPGHANALKEILEVSSWRYQPTELYGGPKLDLQAHTFNLFIDVQDKTKLYIKINYIPIGRVYYLKWNAPIFNSKGDTLWNSETWYTLNKLPKNDSVSRYIPLKKIAQTAGTKHNASVVNKKNSGNQKAKTAAPTIVLANTTKSIQLLDGKQLILEHGCTLCHDPYAKILGPSFEMIYKRYRNTEGARSILTKKVHSGGRGNWGEEAMAAHSHIPLPEIEAMVQYILGGVY